MKCSLRKSRIHPDNEFFPLQAMSRVPSLSIHPYNLFCSTVLNPPPYLQMYTLFIIVFQDKLKLFLPICITLLTKVPGFDSTSPQKIYFHKSKYQDLPVVTDILPVHNCTYMTISLCSSNLSIDLFNDVYQLYTADTYS